MFANLSNKSHQILLDLKILNARKEIHNTSMLRTFQLGTAPQISESDVQSRSKNLIKDSQNSRSCQLDTNLLPSLIGEGVYEITKAWCKDESQRYITRQVRHPFHQTSEIAIVTPVFKNVRIAKQDHQIYHQLKQKRVNETCSFQFKSLINLFISTFFYRRSEHRLKKVELAAPMTVKLFDIK